MPKSRNSNILKPGFIICCFHTIYITDLTMNVADLSKTITYLTTNAEDLTKHVTDFAINVTYITNNI